jgi:hypothetical protein
MPTYSAIALWFHLFAPKMEYFIKTLFKMKTNLSIEKITFTAFCELFQLIDDKRPRGGSSSGISVRFPIGEHHQFSAVYSKSLTRLPIRHRDMLGRPNTRPPRPRPLLIAVATASSTSGGRFALDSASIRTIWYAALITRTSQGVGRCGSGRRRDCFRLRQGTVQRSCHPSLIETAVVAGKASIIDPKRRNFAIHRDATLIKPNPAT